MVTKWAKVLLAYRHDSTPPIHPEAAIPGSCNYVKSCGMPIKNIYGELFLPAQKMYDLGVSYEGATTNSFSIQNSNALYITALGSSDLVTNGSNFNYSIMEEDWKKTFDFSEDTNNTSITLGRYLLGALSFSFGTGSIEPTFEDYQLQYPISEGIIIQNIAVNQKVEGNLFKTIYTISAFTTKDITINEIGLYKVVFPEKALIWDSNKKIIIQEKDAEKVLLDRELINEPIVLKSNDTFNIALELDI